MNWAANLNLEMFHAINGFAGHAKFDQFVIEICDNELVQEAVLGAPYVFIWFLKPKSEDRAKILAGVFAAVTSVLIGRALTHFLPFESRPIFNPISGFHPLAVPFTPDLENWSAFPSDHAALSFGLAFGLFSSSRTAAIILTVLSFILVDLPRVYLGLHYPFDLVGGAGLAAASVCLVNLPIFSAFWRRIEGYAETAGPLFYFAAYILFSETIHMFGGARWLFHTMRSVA